MYNKAQASQQLTEGSGRETGVYWKSMEWLHPLVKCLFNLRRNAIEPFADIDSPSAALFSLRAESLTAESKESKKNKWKRARIYDPGASPNNAINFKLKHLLRELLFRFIWEKEI